jgi:hypothetical protein
MAADLRLRQHVHWGQQKEFFYHKFSNYLLLLSNGCETVMACVEPKVYDCLFCGFIFVVSPL